MRVALIPLKTKLKDPKENLRRIRRRLYELAAANPDLILLPECTLTGYIYEKHDLERFAEPLDATTVQFMAQLARQHNAYLGFGMAERAGRETYNTAILMNRQGEPVLIQRKMSEKPPYTAGARLLTGETEFGTVAFLTCGDLFYPPAREQVAEDVRLILVPMARAFAGKSPDAQRWQNEERAEYLKAVQALGKTALIVNALDEYDEEPAFGGAMVVSPRGEILAEAPHGTDEVLVYDIPTGAVQSQVASQ